MADDMHTESTPSKTNVVKAAPRAPQAKFTVQDFEFGRLLGLGSFSKVARAKLKATGEEFALKVMTKNHIIKENKAGHIRRERVVLDTLDHVGIVRLCFTFQDQYSLYMGLELCPGGELFDQIRRRGRVSTEDARFYAAEIVDILEYLHKQGIVHRDIKPENLLLTAEGHLKLADFGSVKMTNSSIDVPPLEGVPIAEDRKTTFVGTAEYVSPEILNGLPVIPATDLWALGCIVYQMLEGWPPFKAASEYLCFQKILQRDFVMPEHLEPEAQDLIDKLLVLDSTERLGAPGRGGYQALKAHPFFSGVDWQNLWTSPAPAVVGPGPNLDSNSDGEEFDEDEEWDLAQLGGNFSRLRLPKGADPVRLQCGGDFGEGGGGVKNKLLEKADKDIWHDYVGPKEELIACSLVKKTRGLSVKRRQLMLTDKPRLFYADPVKMIIKGEVPWSDDLSVQVESPCAFKVVTPKRTYILEDQRGLAWQWKEAIEGQLSQRQC